MNWDRVEGNWNEFKGKVQQHWGKLTNDAPSFAAVCSSDTAMQRTKPTAKSILG